MQDSRLIARCCICRNVWFNDFEPDGCTCTFEHFAYEIYQANRIPVFWEIPEYGQKPIGLCWVSVTADIARFEKFHFSPDFKIPFSALAHEHRINDSEELEIVEYRIGPAYGPTYARRI